MGISISARIALLLASCTLGVSPALAGKKDKTPQPPVACATESPILVADARSASRFSALMACTDIAEVPSVKPHEIAVGDDVDYVVERTRRDSSGGTSGAMDAVYGQRIAERMPEAGDVRVKSHRAINGMQVVTVAPVVDDPEAELPAYMAPAPAAQPGQTIIAATPAPQHGPVRASDLPPPPPPPGDSIAAAYPGPAVQRVSHRNQAAMASYGGRAAHGSYAPPAAMPPPMQPMQASLGGVAEAILSLRPRSQRTEFDDVVTQVAHRHRIDPLLLHAVMLQESGYRPRIVSRAGAVGLMQIMPGTGAQLGVAREHLTVPLANVDAGARLLRRLATKYNGNFDLVLAAYNAGEGAVQKYGNRIPPYRETQDYVRRVMANYYRFARETGLLANR